MTIVNCPIHGPSETTLVGFVFQAPYCVKCIDEFRAQIEQFRIANEGIEIPVTQEEGLT